MPLEKWLTEERYDEADRKVSSRQPAPANDNRAAPTPKSAAKHVEIDHAEIIEKAADDRVIAFYLIEPATTDGAVEGVPAGVIEIVIESPDSRKQEAGQVRLQSLAVACGCDGIDSVDSLDFHRFTLLADGTFRPAPQEILDLVYSPEAA